jgi:hypothetical protein
MMTSAIATPTNRRMTRDDIVGLGQSGRPWDFTPVAYQALSVAPQDWGLRILCAANLARLGLVTLANEQLEACPPEIRANGSVADLTRAMAAMPLDRLGMDHLQATLDTNLGVLERRGVKLRADVLAWRNHAEGWDWFRALDGNIVRRRGDERRGLADLRGLATRFVAGHLNQSGQDLSLIIVEGIDPPWLLLETAAATSRDKPGFCPRLLVVQHDPVEMLNGLAQIDLRDVLDQERVLVYAGPAAAEEIESDLRARLGGRLVGAYIPQLGLGRRVEPSPVEILEKLEGEQNSEHQRLVESVGATYHGRDRDWWRKRFEDARAGAAPLRVLVPSCRYTTYVKHAGADLVQALRAIGCDAELLIEPDNSFRFSTLSYLRAIDRLKPDLMIMINYTRLHIGDWLPRELPCVCWIQDAMPHQFDPAIGARQGEMDFLVGHVFEELPRRFGYPRSRTMHTPVVASTAKFHPGPVDPGLRKEFECEIALVSHHSEPPEAMHERLVDEAGRGTPTHRVLEELRPQVIALASDPVLAPVHAALEAAARAALRRHLGAEPDARALTLVHKNYCLPLADRLLRHQTLGWAAELAQERGWRLRVYGRGWDSHPRFAPFARGELGHDEELRAAYQCAAVHLHASINTLAHQRVMECALSGGLALCRLIFEVVRPRHVAACRAAIRRGEPVVGNPATRRHGYFITDHPEAAAHTALMQRLGRPTEGFWWVEDKFLSAMRRDPNALMDSQADSSAWLLADLGETTFTTRERLGELVARAVQEPVWRTAWSGVVAGRVRDRFTHQRFAASVIDMVRASFAGDPPQEMRA